MGRGPVPSGRTASTWRHNTMFLADDGGHFVRKVTLDGKVLLELGVPGKPAPYMSGEPFHRCTHTALSPQGHIYVSDGYGNSRVHKYTPDGKLLMSWGEPGTGEGEFNIVHNICCDADGWVYVADRENHRVQVFDGQENFAYTLLLSPDFSKPDTLAVIDVKPGSPTFSQIVHTVTMPHKDDEFHHFGWNACSSALSPLTGHAFLDRRYLIIPGLRSSRIYVVDTKPDPTKATIHKIIEPEEVFKKTGYSNKTGYSRLHTVHCGPEGVYVSTLGGGGKDGTNGPPGIFIMDCETFDILGRWEIDRGPQNLHYDFWWNLPRDYMVSSE